MKKRYFHEINRYIHNDTIELDGFSGVQYTLERDFDLEMEKIQMKIRLLTLVRDLVNYIYIQLL